MRIRWAKHSTLFRVHAPFDLPTTSKHPSKATQFLAKAPSKSTLKSGPRNPGNRSAPSTVETNEISIHPRREKKGARKWAPVPVLIGRKPGFRVAAPLLRRLDVWDALTDFSGILAYRSCGKGGRGEGAKGLVKTSGLFGSLALGFEHKFANERMCDGKLSDGFNRAPGASAISSRFACRVACWGY